MKAIKNSILDLAVLISLPFILIYFIIMSVICYFIDKLKMF